MNTKLNNLKLLTWAILLSLPINTFAQAGAIFTAGPLMNRTRITPYMATLSDGRVAAFGGREYNFISGSHADLYNPSTNAFTEIAMNYPHDFGAVVKLADGTYYVIGGSMDLGVAPGYATTEIFDPVANTFTPSGSMNYARCGMSAAQMTNGKVLIAGGWYSTSSATYADVYSAGTYTVSSAMIQPRSYPLVLPTSDSGAVVFGGLPPYGGSNYTSVEFYSSADNSFHSVSSELIPADPGWLASTSFHNRPSDDYKMSSGKYLICASRTGEYGLLTFDPATKAFARISTSSPLMDTCTDGGFFDIVLNKTANYAYLLGLDSGSTPFKISLTTVDLTTGHVFHPGGTFTMPSNEYLYPTMAYMPSNGKILLEGVSSTTGDYFHATDKTYIITPTAPTSVNSIAEGKNSVTCYPNPAIGTITFSSGAFANSDVKLKIFDMAGRILMSPEYSNVNANFTLTISDLPSGLYIYELSNNGITVRNKFVKQ